MAANEGRGAGAGGGEGGERETEVVLLVCLTCGREYAFEGGETPPAGLACEKCGNMVFRTFEDSAELDEARAEFRDETERDLATDDPAGEATRQDLHDLNNP
jgi:DNA-directed RNA polymerase subunit RPC12/RpoP